MARILIVGSERADALESSYARAFDALGWEVARWDPRAALSEVARAGAAGRLFSDFVHVEAWVRKANVALLQTTARLSPDVLLIIGTAGVRAGSLFQARALSPRMRVYMVYPDSPHNLDADRINCLASCHRVAVSSPAWIEAFRRLGAGTVEYLPFAADTTLFQHPVDLADTAGAAREWDLCFIGTWRAEREALLDAFGDFRLIVWGSRYWKTRSRQGSVARKCWGGRELLGTEFVSAARQSAIMLNILDPVSWPGPNMRAFEVPACKGFSLSTRTPAILEIFREGETIECFDSPEEAREKARFYLTHEESRARIARAAFERVVEGGHTYLDRARTVIKWAEEDVRAG